MCFRRLIGTGFVLVILLLGCNRIDEKALFNYPVESVHDINYTDTLAPRLLLEDADLTEFTVVDSHLFSYLLSGKESLSVTSIHEKRLPIRLCTRGRGPGEFVMMAPSMDYYDGHLTLVDSYQGRCYKLNVKESLDSAKTVIDREIQLPGEYDYYLPVRSAFSLGGDSLLVYLTVMEDGTREREPSETPVYLLVDLSSNEVIGRYDCFGQFPTYSDRNRRLTIQQILHAGHCLAPDRNSLCFAMLRTPQIGIMDIPSGSTRGFRLAGRPPMSRNKMYFYFLSVSAWGDLIYALYAGEEKTDSLIPLSPSTLYVFDWEGKIRAKYLLDASYQRCMVTSDGLYLSKWEDDARMGLYFLEMPSIHLPEEPS